jgi:hypothetical protein
MLPTRPSWAASRLSCLPLSSLIHTTPAG